MKFSLPDLLPIPISISQFLFPLPKTYETENSGRLSFFLTLLYYLCFTSFLKNYIRFSTFFVFATMDGSISLSLILHFFIPTDSLTSFLHFFNFSVIGVLLLFSTGFPIIWRQSYMVFLGIFVTTWFTKLLEWTTWSLLVARVILLHSIRWWWYGHRMGIEIMKVEARLLWIRKCLLLWKSWKWEMRQKPFFAFPF